MNCKQMVAAVALVCWMASPSLLAQDFLKQLEEKILKRQEEAKAKDSAAKETKNSKPSTDSGNAGKPGPGESLLQLNPPVATPREAGPNEAEPKVGAKNASNASDEENELLPPPRSATGPKRASAAPPPFPTPQQTSPQSTNTRQARPQQPPSQQPGGGYLGMTVESSPGGGFGLNVAQVTPDSPAFKAGFRPGDRLIGVEGAAVATVEDFAIQLAEYPPGTPIRFLVDRRGKNMSLVAVLMDRSIANRIHGNVPGAIPYEPVAPQPGEAYFGVNVANMSEAFRKQFAIGAYRGASVTDVISGSPAERAGLRPGDCIVTMRGEEVKNADDVYDHILTASPGELLEFTFYRGSILQREMLCWFERTHPRPQVNGRVPVSRPRC